MNAPAPPHHVMIAPREAPPALLEALRARFGANFSTALAVREQHGRDESAFTTVPPPAAVVFAESTQDVQDAVRLCARHRVPVIPYGVGSSLEGHLLAVQGGISLDVSRMNRVLAGPRRGPDGHRAAGRDAQAAQRRDPVHRPVLPHRPRRRCQHRRHGGHARQRHQRRALRHHARERAGAGGGHRARRGHPHRHARQEEQRRLRPHAPDGRQRGHAGRHHRNHAASSTRCPRRCRRRSALSQHRRRGEHGDPDHPARRAHRARGADRRQHGGPGQPPPS
jgi:hypothetical protein